MTQTISKSKLKKGDEIIVTAGRDKGRRGTITEVLKGSGRVLVDGVNMVKKHMRGNPNTGTQGGIIDREAPIAISNVAIFNPKTKKADRVGFTVLKDGKKVRCFKSNQEQIDI